MRLLLLSAGALIASAGLAAAQTFAVENARIIANDGSAAIESGTVVIENGMLSAFGADAAAPEGATRIDGEGLWVTPGAIAPVTALGLVEVGAVSGSNDTSADDLDISLSLSAADAYNPLAAPIAVTRIEGVTHAGISIGSDANIFGGRGALVELSGDYDPVVQEDAFVFLNLGEGGARGAGETRAGSWAFLRKALDEAQAHGGLFYRRPENPALNEADAKVLKRAINGGIPLIIDVDRSSDILRVLRLTEDFPRMDLILHGVSEGWMVADAIAAAEVPVIVTPENNLPGSFETLGARIDNATLLNEAGVTVALNTGGGHQVRLVYQQAGIAVAHGMSWEDAFAAITTIPAEMLGASELGVLRTGQAATLVVWDGDPLEVTSSPVAVFIDGERIPLVSRQTRLRDRYLDLDDDTPLAYRD